MAQETNVARESVVKALNAVGGTGGRFSAGDVFLQKPVAIQSRLHNLMYSGATVSVDDEAFVALKDLIPTQKYLNQSQVNDYMRPRRFDDMPIVATYKGKTYVIDGHHRVAASILRGDDKIKVVKYNLR